MIAVEQLRKYEVLIDGVWNTASFGQLDAGDYVRCFEPDGTFVNEFVVLQRPGVEAEIVKGDGLARGQHVNVSE